MVGKSGRCSGNSAQQSSMHERMYSGQPISESASTFKGIPPMERNKKWNDNENGNEYTAKGRIRGAKKKKKRKHCRGARFVQYNRPDKETMLVIQG